MRCAAACAAVVVISATQGQAQAADFYWDSDATATGNDVNGSNLGGGGLWDLVNTFWWDGSAAFDVAWANSTNDRAFFTYAYIPGPPSSNTVTLSSGISANALHFLRSGYTLTGGDLTLGGTDPGFYASLGTYTVIESLIAGSGGLTLSGGGSIRLANSLNSYTGTTTIGNGSLVIASQSALGADSSAVVVTERNTTPSNTSTTGFPGGSLVLDGSAGGFDFSRDVSLQGLGPIGGRNAALISIGDNTLSGQVNMAAGALSPVTFRNTRLIQTNGTLTISTGLNAAGTAGTTVSSLGGVNSTGAGNIHLTGALSGTGTLEKTGSGALFLTSSDTSGFSGRLRVSGSATVGQSSVRVTSLNDGANSTSVFGTANATGGSGPIDMGGGVLEIRNDGSLSFGKNVYFRENSTIYTGPAAGGAGINGTTTFGTFRIQADRTATFNSRNGFGVAFGAWTQESSNQQNTVTNNLGGLLTFTGDAWNNSDGSARTLTIGGNGNTLITGSINTSGAGVKTLTKTGSGSLTINGTATSLDGPVNINGGAIVARDFRSLNNTAGTTINIGATTTAGALIIGTATTPTAAGLTSSKVINLAGTTGGASIYANQTGTSPVILNANFTATGGTAANAKTLTLGGASTADNIVNGTIPNNAAGGTVNLTKVGSGTWVLAGANTYTGTTTIANGTLKIKANAATSTILPATNAVTFNQTNSRGGSTLEFAGQNSVNNVQTLGTLTTTAGANTLKLTPGTGGTASLVFGGLATSSSSTMNVVGADFTSNTVTIPGANGLISRTVYWNGADYAYRESNVLRAPVYDSDATFVTAGAALAAGNNLVLGDISGQATHSAVTLKFDGSHTLTLNTGATLTLTGAGVLVTGGASAITGGTALATGTGALVVRVNEDTDTLTIGSVITGSGGLNKVGEGTLVLTAANTRTGLTTINEGTVQLSGSGRLGNADSLNIRHLGTYDLNGVTSATNINSFTNAGRVINSSATAVTLTVGDGNGTGTSYGIIDQTNGVINLTKLGTGAQSWLGSSTYTGATTIGSTGLVTVDTLADIGVASGIGKGDSTDDSTNAASLVFDGSTGGLVYQGSLVNGDLTLGSTSASTNRLFTLSGTGATLSSTASNNNAVVWSHTGAIVHGTNADRTLTLTGTSAGDNTFNPQFTDSAGFVSSLNKTNTGQWNLGNANNTYTGATTIANGVLALNASGSLPANSPVVLGQTTTPGILQMSGTFARNLTTTPTAGSGTVTWGGTTGGGGFAAHTTQLVVSLNGGAGLTWGSGGFVGTGGTQALLFGSASGLADVVFQNAIDLGAAQRTVTVNDNTNTGADFATMSGVLGGTGGGLQKTGSGILRLTGANTYTGVTDITTGALMVSSLGHSSDSLGTATSVGVSGVTFDNTNAITIGNASTSNAVLQYTGPGEVSDRKIRINATTGTSAGAQIHADGSGPLILTNVANDMVSNAGTKNLWLRGSNAAGNMITSPLSDFGGPLDVRIDGAATWILTNSGNSYSGLTSVTAGALGIGHDSALGNSTLVNGNGNLFAFGGDRTIANNLTLSNNTAHGFIGEYSLTFNGPNNLAAGANNVTTNNNIASGKALTFNGLTANSMTANRTWTIDGSGETVINGDFTTTTAFGLAIAKTGNGTLTLGTNGTPTSNNPWNQSNAVIDVDRGTLKFVASNAISAAAGAGGLVISPELDTADVATVDLNGTTQTVNALTATSNGTLFIDNTSATAAEFRFGANNSTVNFGSGVGSYTIQNTGSGALDIVKLGNTSATFISGITLGHAGVTASEGGGTFTIASPLTATTGLRVIDGSTLALTGGITNPALITNIIVDGGATLNLLDGAGSLISNLDTLSLGAGSGTATLNLNVGDGATDTLTLLTGSSATLNNSVTFNMTDAGLSANTTYTLLHLVDGGITAFGIGNLIQGASPGGFSSMTWDVDDYMVQLTTGNLILGNWYWNAGNAAWNVAANWDDDKTSSIARVSAPGAGSDVKFVADSLTGGAAVTTTLEQNFKVNSLTFEASTTPANTPASVTINPGADPASRLEIAPQNSSDGIAVTTGGPAAATIGASLRLGADQTWTVADSATVLSIGSLLGEADVTKSGAGKVILTAAAAPTFNSGQTSNFTIAGGNFEIQNTGALGTLANSNLATVTVTGGGFFFNGAASTTVNPITLSGGALSAGSNTQTYSSQINVSAASTINMADSNGAPTAAARSITLSGGLTGTGDLTVNSNSTVSGGNQIGGTLTLNQDNSGWSGNWNILRGTVTTNNASGFGAGTTITMEKGKLAFTSGAGTPAVTQNIVIASATEAAVGEFNLGSGIATTFSGQVSLGGAGGAGELRVYMNNDAATATLTGGVVLANNGGLGTQNAATRLLDVASVISESGGARTLTINDSAWGGTPGIVRLSAANTYTGGTNLARGTLQMNHVSALSSGPLTAAGASTFNSLVDLTGPNALSNALNLGAVLTFTGDNGVTFNGTTTNAGAGGITNSLTSGDLLFAQVNLAEPAAATARNLTVAGASTGNTTVSALLNNDQNNTLTNNLTGNSLAIGTIALSESAGTGRTLTLSGTGNTVVTGVIEDVAGGSGTAGTLAKSGTGVLTLQGASTFTGPVTIAAGVLEYGTVTNIGGAASNLGQGSAITMTGGTLRFIGSSAQSTDRPITTSTGAVTLSANGATPADTITYAGAITVGPTGDGSQLTLTGATGREGIIAGGIAQSDTSADVTVSGGTWTLSGALNTIADDLFVTGAGTILNLDSTSVLKLMSGATTSDLSVRDGAVLNINANGAVDYSAASYRLFVGQGADGADAVLNLNANLQSGRFILGERGLTRVGIVNGTGTLTVDNAATDFIQLYRGEINANLASSGTGAGIFRKVGSGTVTLRGNNSGLTHTGITQIDDGTLVLDYTLNNATKLRADSQLDMRGATLQILGNNAAATSQNVNGLTLATGAGLNILDVTAGTGQTATLALGALSRATGAGTLRINLLNAGAAVTTSTANTNGILGLSAYTTVRDGTGTWFGTNSSGNVVALASTLDNSIGNWVSGDHVSDSGSGFTGTVTANHLNSVRFNAAGGSTVNLATGGILTIGTGGILVTDQVTSGSPGIFGGTLGTGATELIVTHDSAQTFEISSRIGVNNAFTTTGTGTVLLSGNNAYTGGTNIQSGTLRVTGNSIGDSSLVTLASNRNSILELQASETIGRLQGGQRATNSDYGTVAIGSHTLTLNQAGGTTAYLGVFTGDGSIVMSAASASTLNMTGLSTGFTGTVEINGGLFQLSAAASNDAASFTINGNGSMLIDNNSTTSSTTRILNTSPIIMNSVASGTNIRGLWVRNTDNNSSRFETIGNLVFNSGANYLTGEANVGTGNGRAGVIANDFIRNDNATVSVRGRNLGTALTHHNQFRIGTSANQTAFINALTGGGGSAGSATISIVPWAIGETHNATSTGATNMGNSLVTYVSGAGFRPLDFTTEYATYGTAGDTNNIRESLTTDATGLPGRTLNALVLYNANTAASTINVTGLGAGESIVNTSGVSLFTLNPSATASSAHQFNVSGFEAGIAVGGTEYLFFVQNPSAAANTAVLTATVSSPLVSSADITKAGRGTLVLTTANTAGGGANKTTLNEGVLEIADLDHIGGNTGSLVFAGGALRLGGTYSGDDLSSRAISFLIGGGALDTNGIDLALANSLGSGVGGFTKTGLGNLTLNGTATYTGPTTISNGTLTIGANNALGVGGDLSIGAGATLALGSNSLSHGLVTTSGASPQITGTGTLTAASGFFFNHTGDTTIDALLAGPGGVFKAQSNIVTLNGLNSYTGTTEVRAGGLSFDSITNVGGGASALGNPGNVEDGILRMGLTTAATSLTYTGTGHSTDRLIGMQGTTGGVTVNANGTGALVLTGGVRFETPGNKTLTLGGTSDLASVNIPGPLVEQGGVLSVTKSGTNLWSYNQTYTYTGATSVDNGTLRLTAAQNLTGALQFGSATSVTTAGRLEVNENSTFGSLLAQTNTATASQLDISSGKSLTITGDVRIGSSLDTGSVVSNTFLTATGDGSFIVNNPNPNGFFRVGGYPATGTGGTAGRGNRADADFSALASMQINLDPATGIVRVNNPSAQNTTGSYATLSLAKTSSLTANQLIVGDGGQFGGGVDQINTVYLGGTANTLNVDTILIGTGGRDYGAVLFGGATGTVQIRSADGLGRATFDMATAGGTGTGTVNATGNVFDVTGHSADLLFDAVTIGAQNRGNNSNNAFSFDTGTLDINSLAMAIRSANPGTGTAANWITNSTVNLGGGNVTIQNGVTAMAQITGSLNAATAVNATINITGGTVNIGETGGTSIAMASASAGTATANLNLTGGATTLAGDIVRGGGAGATTATVTLDGGMLDMNGNSIGDGTHAVTFAAQSGTLQNLGELNGGGTLTKTAAGTLILEGTNNYPGDTAVNAGTLLVDGTTASASDFTIGTGSPDDTITLGGGGTIGGSVTADGGRLAAGTASGIDTLNITGTVSASSSSTWLVNLTSLAGGDPSGGTNVDLITIAGNITNLNNFTLQIVDSNIQSDNADDKYKFASFAGMWDNSFFTGHLGGVFYGTNNSSAYTVEYDGTNGAFYLVSAIPEPEVWLPAILILGLGLGLRRRRR